MESFCGKYSFPLLSEAASCHFCSLRSIASHHTANVLKHKPVHQYKRSTGHIPTCSYQQSHKKEDQLKCGPQPQSGSPVVPATCHSSGEHDQARAPTKRWWIDLILAYLSNKRSLLDKAYLIVRVDSQCWTAPASTPLGRSVFFVGCLKQFAPPCLRLSVRR